MAKEIDAIIDEVLRYVEDLESRVAAGRKAVEFLRSCKFGPVTNGPRYPGDRGDGLPGPEDRIEPSRSQRRPYRKIQEHSTPFKGVYKRTFKNGTVKYKASYWDKENKKHVYLGLYDSEFEAAAAYAEHIGDHKEAAMLRAMAKENAELNPDKPLDSTSRHEAKRKGEFIWVCKRCGLEYKSSGTCAGCGNDDMQKVPLSSRGG